MSNFPSEGKTFFGVVVDSKEDLGRILYKVFVPALHGKDVKFSDLPFIPAAVPPTLDGAATSGGGLSKGQPVQFYKGMGEGANGFGTIIGLFQPVINGNRDLNSQNMSIAQKLIVPLEEQARNIRLPPDLYKTLENGVEVIKTKEKGDYSLSSLFGFATHGALNPIGQGAVIPKTTAIPTAKQQHQNILTSSMLSSVPGSNFDLTSIFKMIPTSTLNGLPPEAKEILNTVQSMMQTYTPGNFGSSGFEGTKIDPTAMLSMVTQGLPDVKDAGGMIDLIMKMLQTTGTSSSFIGNIQIGADGNVGFGLDSIIEGLLSQFAGSLGSFESSSGKMFDSVPDFGKMVQRMTPDVNNGIKSVISFIQTNSPAQVGNEFVK